MSADREVERGSPRAAPAARRSAAPRRPLPAVSALAALAGAIPVLARFARVAPRFDGLYGQDAYAYFDYAVGPLFASLRLGTSLPPFHWPPGYPLAVALASVATGATPLAGQWVSALAGALVPLFTYLLVREAWPADSGEIDGRRVALLAGAIAGFTPQLGQSSVVVMADTTSLAAATGGAWMLARYLNALQRGADARPAAWLVPAAASLAFSVYTRWGAALIVLPVLAYAATALATRVRPRWQVLVAHALVAALVALAVLAPLLQPMVASFAGRGDVARHSVDLEVVLSTWNPANAPRAEFENADGRQRYAGSNLAFYLLAPARHALLTPVFALALPFGLWCLARSRRPEVVVLWVGWPAVVTMFLVGISWQNFRYLLLMLPPLATWAALGIDVAWRAASRRGRALLASLVVAGLVWQAVAGERLIQRFVARKDATLDLIAWTEARTPADALLVTLSVTGAFAHYGRLDVRELYGLGGNDVDALVASGRPLRLLIDVANVEGQWRSLSPGENLRRFQAKGCLKELGSHPPFTLFEVTPRPTGGRCVGSGEGSSAEAAHRSERLAPS